MDRVDAAAHAEYIGLLTLLVCPQKMAQQSEIRSAAIPVQEALPYVHTAVEVARHHHWLGSTLERQSDDVGDAKRRRLSEASVDPAKLVAQAYSEMRRQLSESGHPAMAPIIGLL